MNNLLLQVENLSVSFINNQEKKIAVENIAFALHEKETLAIVGESGSGKSVTCLAILQLLPYKSTLIESGTINFYQNNQAVNLATINAINEIRGNDIGMVFQEPMTSLNPVYTCGNQIIETIIKHKKISYSAAKKIALQLLQEVELPHPEISFNKYPHELSGGQKQRVMIAIAISCNPKILICDEPTTALDVTVQKSIIELLKKLQEKNGMGIIFISHDLGLVADIAHHIMVMYKGKIVETGTTKKILQNPQQPYTKALLACRPILYKPQEKLPTVESIINNTYIKKENYWQTNDSNQVLLEVKNVSKVYYKTKNIFNKKEATFNAVDNVSFTIYKGETVGLVGESGCGKTTLGRCILNIISPTQGAILFNGINIAENKKHGWLSRKMQLIFQDPYSSLNPTLTIGQAIVEPMLVHKLTKSNKEAKDKTIYLLEKVGLSKEHFNRYPHQFSGGQRQRIVIARALAVEPEFIVCDESVSALDVSVQAQILNLLNELKQTFNLTLLFISHDLSVIQYISNRVLVMQKGKIVEEALSKQIFTNPQHYYTQQLLNSVPQIRF